LKPVVLAQPYLKSSGILLLYVDDVVLMERCPSDIDKQLRTVKEFYSNMGLTVNIDKTKVMIIKSNNESRANFVYMIITTWRKFLLTNILELIFITSSTIIIAFRK